MEGKEIKFKERKPLFALALSLFLIGLGQVYNGKLRKGVFFFLISIIFPLLLFQLSVVGPGKMLIVFLLLSLLATLGIYIWAALDAWKRAKRIGKNYTLKTYNKLYIYILLIIVLNLFSFGPIFDWQKICFFALPYRMATGSMIPTVLPGDFIMTDRRIDHSAENHGLKRGELVVFKYPENKENHFIKRVIGLPGDEIEIKGMELFVNGERRTGKEVSYLEGKRDENIKEGTVALYEEGDSETYVVFFLEDTARENLSVAVPEGYCFVLGDNRDKSADSRHWGMVPLIDVISRAKQIYFSVNPEGGIRWGRIGKLL
ncbi:MAG: signal peptidase I [Candidatus Aminicenantes bacterium]|nr:signal peptidase I [Candidatus Aminicenantes bacterium]MDH5385259.1 signal peptidase I [Candidatus Aminicenantes bacterium]